MEKVIFLVADSHCGKSSILLELKGEGVKTGILKGKLKGRIFYKNKEKWFIPQMSLDELGIELEVLLNRLIADGYSGLLIGCYQKSILKSLTTSKKHLLDIKVLYLESSKRPSYKLNYLIYNPVKVTSGILFLQSESKTASNLDNAKILLKLM